MITILYAWKVRLRANWVARKTRVPCLICILSGLIPGAQNKDLADKTCRGYAADGSTVIAMALKGIS
jgi:hypothetical protein